MSEPVHAEHVARKEFSLSFRGFDQHEVRAFLATVAGELSAWEERERTLRARLTDLEQQPKAVEELDEATIEAALGETATRIIHAAREAAADVRNRADAEAAKKLDEAEAILAKSTAEAAESNAALRANTEAALRTLREESDQKAGATVEAARAKAVSLIADANDARDRTLRDLADRRDAIVAEIEQLQAARDRLRAAHDSVRSALDVAVLDVEAAEMRANDILARVKPLDAPAPSSSSPSVTSTEPAPGAEVEDVIAEVDAEVVEVPAADDAVAIEPEDVGAEISEDEPADEAEAAPAVEPPEERRSSALRLLRSRPEADGNPTAPPVQDPYEGVRIIRPDVTREQITVDVEDGAAASEAWTATEATAHDAPATPLEASIDDVVPLVEEPAAEAVDDAPEADGAVTVDDAVEPGDAVATEAPPVEVDEIAASNDDDAPLTSEDAPVDDLFARLRADRAATVAKATAVLAATDPSPSEPSEEERAPAAAVDADESPDLAILAARDDAVADAERSVVRSLKRALADEQNEVLDALRRLRGKPSVEALLPDSAVHEARYDAVLGSGAAAAALAGGELVGGGGDAGAVTAEIGRALAIDLRGRVTRSIDDAGGDVETLAEAISATYREWKTSRAEPLARDVIAAAFASGTYVAASGSLRWVVDPAEGGCPDCEDNALAGGTAKGTAYPTGQVRPPAHAGCRCALVPVS